MVFIKAGFLAYTNEKPAPCARGPVLAERMNLLKRNYLAPGSIQAHMVPTCSKVRGCAGSPPQKPRPPGPPGPLAPPGPRPRPTLAARATSPGCPPGPPSPRGPRGLPMTLFFHVFVKKVNSRCLIKRKERNNKDCHSKIAIIQKAHSGLNLA